MKLLPALTLLAAISSSAQQAPIPDGYWPESKADAILARTETIRLAPDLSGLTAGEQAALKDLFEVGSIMQKLYESARHPDALPALDQLRVLDVSLGQPPRTQKLLSLYRLFQGPIATTLTNEREAFLPVSRELPGRNVYPLDVTREELDAFLAKNPSMRDEILAERTVVRRASTKGGGLEDDIPTLTQSVMLRLLHPGLFEHLKALQAANDRTSFYGIPYAVAYPELVRAFNLLMRAAGSVESSDPEFARYLRNRGRDLVNNDYESGDASWVTGRFKRLNAQIGAYETYDDTLYGVKAFHSMSILLANEKATAELRSALGGLQAIEDALPYENHKQGKEDIPVGVYEVIADFGQARGTNTATILPNDPLFARRYGRTILLRENIMRHPDIYAADLRVWRSTTAAAHAGDFADDGDFQRTLWHEVGHYLGVDRDKNGRTLDVALEDYADSTEEMKADLVSLFALNRMKHPSLRAIQAAGIRRTLQNVQPRRDQPYQTMQLLQFNWFVDKGLITPDPKTGRLSIDYAKYPVAVESLLRDVLALQHNGDKKATATFFEKWTKWTDVHEKVAARVREAQGARFRIVRYAALGE
jgi:hypothetical protein